MFQTYFPSETNRIYTIYRANGELYLNLDDLPAVYFNRGIRDKSTPLVFCRDEPRRGCMHRSMARASPKIPIHRWLPLIQVTETLILHLSGEMTNTRLVMDSDNCCYSSNRTADNLKRYSSSNINDWRSYWID